MDNASEITSRLNIKTAKTLSSIPVTRADIAKIIKKRCKWFLFKYCFESNYVSLRMEKANVVPVYEIVDKQSFKIVAPYHYYQLVQKYLNDIKQDV